MSNYGGLPDEVTRAGMDFNYALWTAGTHISFHNVPWNCDYRDIVKFPDQLQLDEYLNQNVGSERFTYSSYSRVGETVKVGLPFNYCYQFNYLRVHNPAQPVGKDTPRTFYYFIKDVRHIAPETTELVVQLDVWQTFNHLVQFGNCYVERGHIGIANTKNMDDKGRQYLTIPEGFDVGNEYFIHDVYAHKIADNSAANPAEPYSPNSYHVLVWATTHVMAADYGSMTDPNLDTAKGTSFENLPNGAEVLWFTNPNEFKALAQILSKYPWISQGIISVMVVPPFELEPGRWQDMVIDKDGIQANYRWINHSDSDVPPKVVTLKTNWRNSIDLGQRYRHLKKFLTYPYCAVELTTYTGQPLLLKPESMPDTDFKVIQLQHYALPNPRLAFVPYRYNGKPGFADGAWDGFMSGEGHDNAEFLDMSTGISNFPTFSVVNDGYRSYMAANANQIAYQHNSADWSQQRALTANQLGYNQSSAQMDMQNALTSLGIDASTQSMLLANQTAGFRGIVGMGESAVGGVLRGGMAGAIAGMAGDAANTAITMNQNTQQTGINNALASGRNREQVGTAGYVRDTNKDFADYAAKGDYAMAIGAINAKVQDAKLIQPTTSGQIGGDAFNLVAFRWVLHAKVKRISPASLVAIGEYWLRYGYAINRFATPPASLNCMTKFTYWKMRETYLRVSPMPESFRQTIRGIFEKGVTVWTNPSFIGNVDLSTNDPVGGITL